MRLIARLPIRRNRHADDPSIALFDRIRRRLTFWYTGVLGATLLVLGAVLYLGEQQSLLGPVDGSLRSGAGSMLVAWQTDPTDTCRRASPTLTGNLLWACYDSSGRLVGADPIAGQIPRFVRSSAVRRAWQHGSALDTIDSGTVFGSVRVYALRFTDSTSGQPLGVILIGTSVSVATQALRQLLILLLLGGSLGVLFAAVGGIFLAGRSLAPARLAYARQRDFVANASHELRTPLTMVRADAEVLLRDRVNLTEDQTAILEDVVTETAHMASLAGSMLELARLDSGQTRVDRDVVDLARLARDVVRRAEPLAAERDVCLRVGAVETALVFGDLLLLQHAVLILVDNAIKYNRPGGEVVVETRSDGTLASIAVRDTGIGIAAEHLPHLGERFYRVDRARSRESGGAGLGLSIARSVAAHHSGDLRIESEPDVGTTVTLSLPSLTPTRSSA